eukprot:Amastigsp_a174580_1573.p2 type:complete len:130 gc:universal Amastigsp_a174580_1573:217-606(+)
MKHDRHRVVEHRLAHHDREQVARNGRRLHDREGCHGVRCADQRGKQEALEVRPVVHLDGPEDDHDRRGHKERNESAHEGIQPDSRDVRKEVALLHAISRIEDDRRQQDDKEKVLVEPEKLLHVFWRDEE